MTELQSIEKKIIKNRCIMASQPLCSARWYAALKDNAQHIKDWHAEGGRIRLT